MLYANFRTRHLAAGTARAVSFLDFRREGGAALRQFSVFEALVEHFSGTSPPAWRWQEWPQEYRSPDTSAVERFAAEHAERVEFFEYLQWQAAMQLASADGGGKQSLDIGLYIDLAISVDPSGAEAWAKQDLYAAASAIGAPPDEYNLSGQNWGLPPLIPSRLRAAAYQPLIDTFRATMKHAGALRVDHVMGLSRLYWVPPGASAREGAYVHYPVQDILGVLALESHRNQCLVIGEDLGTVPDELRATLQAASILSYRLLIFERDDAAGFRAPSQYPALALVACSTHDLPTMAGYWRGEDISARDALGLYPHAEQRDASACSRARGKDAIFCSRLRARTSPKAAPERCPIPLPTPPRRCCWPCIPTSRVRLRCL